MPSVHAARIAAIAQAHLRWSREVQRPADPGKLAAHGGGSDYSEHHLDVDPPAGTEERFHALVAEQNQLPAYRTESG